MSAPQSGYHMGFTLPHETASPPPLPSTITTQPHVKSEPTNNWMNKPQTIPNCPPGLEYLTTIDQLIVHQTSDVLQVAAGFETENQYYIANKNDQKIYYAQEKSDAFARNCCKARRAFEMKVFDNFGKEVIHMTRPFACQAFCFFCCLQSMEVFSPPGTPVGVIEQEWSLFSPSYIIKNGDGDVVLRIKGPCNLMNCCSDADFKVMSADGSVEVGKIFRKTELAQQVSSKADNFGIMFPMNLDVRMKAVLIGTCFLIDMIQSCISERNPNPEKVPKAPDPGADNDENSPPLKILSYD
ncbi:hypothetical protein FQR65_LT15033 [Abscondita terminalis]|nr:hypothetical protein FQR65_LT15033 [Abscondita terminalis]